MARFRLLIAALVLSGALACNSQTAALQLGASYNNLQFQGSTSGSILAVLQDCTLNSCRLDGSAYGTGALQSSGSYTLTTTAGTALSMINLGSGAYSVSHSPAWWFLYTSSAGNLAGELQLSSAQDSTTTGQVVFTGVLSALSGSLAAGLGGSAAVTLHFYDGAGLQALLGTANAQTASVAPGSVLTPATSTSSTPPPSTTSSSTSSSTTTTSGSPAAASTASGAGGLDAYGGLNDVTVNAGTGFFSVQKVGERWVFVDPSGHPFWMLGVFAVDLNTDTSLGSTYTLAKYGSMANWGLQAVRRLRSWGFNSTAEYSSAYVVPVDNDGNFETTEPMPWVAIVRPAYYSLRDQNGYAPQPVKDLVNGLDSVYTNYRGDTLPDVFDPDFAVYASQYAAANTSAAEAASPWLIGTAVDDLDDLWGFGPGPGLPAARTSSNIGWIALCTDFQQAANTRLGAVYTDTEIYTKTALANWLAAKYGFIAALNQAWGSDYTTFGDAGGYGTGSGLLDEDGRHAWIGSDDVALSTANPQVRSDLNAFTSIFAQKYFSVVTAAVRAARPHQLVFGPCTLNGWNGVSRPQILAAAAQYTDVIQASMASQSVYDASLAVAGDHPFVTWTGMPANPDSDLSAYANPDAPDVYATQAARGQAYAGQLANDFGFTGSAAAGTLAGSQNVVGSKFWAWTDSWGERTNWGLVTFLDNPYDGVSDVVAPGTDAWGYATGGEAANHGNFIGPAAQANQGALTSLQNSLNP